MKAEAKCCASNFQQETLDALLQGCKQLASPSQPLSVKHRTETWTRTMEEPDNSVVRLAMLSVSVQFSSTVTDATSQTDVIRSDAAV